MLEPIPTPRLAELRIGDLTPAEVRLPHMGPEAEKAVRAAFFSVDAFEQVDGDDPSACRGHANVGYVLMRNDTAVLTAESGAARAVIEAEVQCPLGGGEVATFRDRAQDERRFTDGTDSGRVELAAAVRHVAEVAGRTLHGQIRVRGADDERIRELLRTSRHAGMLSEAASEAGERKLTDAADDLVRLTAHLDERVSVRAGAALGLMRVQREDAIRALAKMTNGPSRERHIIAIHALGDIGGDTAARYLDNLAVGHPDAEIRALARETAGRARGKSTP